MKSLVFLLCVGKVLSFHLDKVTYKQVVDLGLLHGYEINLNGKLERKERLFYADFDDDEAVESLSSQLSYNTFYRIQSDVTKHELPSRVHSDYVFPSKTGWLEPLFYQQKLKDVDFHPHRYYTQKGSVSCYWVLEDPRIVVSARQFKLVPDAQSLLDSLKRSNFTDQSQLEAFFKKYGHYQLAHAVLGNFESVLIIDESNGNICYEMKESSEALISELKQSRHDLVIHNYSLSFPSVYEWHMKPIGLEEGYTFLFENAIYKDLYGDRDLKGEYYAKLSVNKISECVQKSRQFGIWKQNKSDEHIRELIEKVVNEFKGNQTIWCHEIDDFIKRNYSLDNPSFKPQTLNNSTKIVNIDSSSNPINCMPIALSALGFSFITLIF